ncbi:MAG: LptE family protein [Rikenellaceae bacterium]
MKKIVNLVILSLSVLLVGCGYTVGYTLSGASIPPDAKSYSVAYFPNNATMVAPILSSTMTDALKEYFNKRTRLTSVSEGGDFAFEGEITNYTSTTASVSASSTSDYGALNRLTITVKVRFTNALDDAASFNRTFSAFADYESTKLLTEVEGELIPEIVDQIVDDIFQASASNW